MRPVYLIGSIGLAIALILALDHFFPLAEPPAETVLERAVPQDPAPIFQEVAPPAKPPSQVTEPLSPPIELPSLNESDEFVREQLVDFALPGKWLTLDELVRRASVVLENTARGVLPRNQLEWLAPQGAFAVRREGNQYWVDPAGYARYDTMVGRITRVTPERWAQLFHTLEPLLDLALRELGGDTQSSSELLKLALQQVEQTPVLTKPAQLIRPKVTYLYVDTQLESMSALQKQLLRMGPKNVADLKALAAGIETHTYRDSKD